VSAEKTRLRVLALCHLLVGIPAVMGGGSLAVWPSGRLLGITVELLRQGPFTDFLLPGLMLYGLGVTHLITAYLCAKAEPGSEVVSAVTGTALLLWLTGEASILHATSWLQLVYAVLGVSILAQAIWLFRAQRVARRS
jgi:hypothetical protein